MLQAHTYRYTLGLKTDAARVKHTVSVARRVAGGEDDRRRIALAVGSGDRCHSLSVELYTRHTAAEMHLAAVGDDSLPYRLDDDGQAVGADVGVGIDEHRVIGSVGVEYLQHLVDRATLYTACIELAVGVSACSTLSETIIGVGVDHARAAQLGLVASTRVDVLAALQHNRLQPQLNQLQGGEEPRRTCSYHRHRSRSAHVGIAYRVVAAGVSVDRKIDTHRAAARVDGAASYVGVQYVGLGHANLPGDSAGQQRRHGGLLRSEP